MQFLCYGSPHLLLDCLHCIQRLYRPPLCLQPNMAVMLQHLPAEMAADRLNGGVWCLCLRQSRDEVVA